MKLVVTLFLAVFIVLLIMSTVYSTNKVHTSLNDYYIQKNTTLHSSGKNKKSDSPKYGESTGYVQSYVSPGATIVNTAPADSRGVELVKSFSLDNSWKNRKYQHLYNTGIVSSPSPMISTIGSSTPSSISTSSSSSPSSRSSAQAAASSISKCESSSSIKKCYGCDKTPPTATCAKVPSNKCQKGRYVCKNGNVDSSKKCSKKDRIYCKWNGDECVDDCIGGGAEGSDATSPSPTPSSTPSPSPASASDSSQGCSGLSGTALENCLEDQWENEDGEPEDIIRSNVTELIEYIFSEEYSPIIQ